MAITQYFTATTLDGFIADSDNSLQWLLDVPPERNSDESRLGGVHRRGRCDRRWARRPGVGGRPRAAAGEPGAVAGHYGDRPCWVFTTGSCRRSPADVRFVGGDLTAVHAEMQAAAGGRNVWMVGGGDLVGQFHDAGLLDRDRVLGARAGDPRVRRATASQADRGDATAHGATGGAERGPDVRRAATLDQFRAGGAARVGSSTVTGSPGRTSPPRRTTAMTPARRTARPSASRTRTWSRSPGWNRSICPQGLRSPVSSTSAVSPSAAPCRSAGRGGRCRHVVTFSPRSPASTR